LTPASGGQYIPAKCGQGYWLSQLANKISEYFLKAKAYL
jgi:hypothetical protein